ncbi:hypothetical protein NE237_006190 [Protea cynaroides]|uniref:Uncharacterized protein n=1 Tax=Protea cynaroides TaxID=273540 RepID=A0A9Q0KM34_9MAGN|nr:hypothetical protein NE237_006190 [Protea cynaroides]
MDAKLDLLVPRLTGSSSSVAIIQLPVTITNKQPADSVTTNLPQPPMPLIQPQSQPKALIQTQKQSLLTNIQIHKLEEIEDLVLLVEEDNLSKKKDVLLRLGHARDDKDGTIHLSNHVLDIISSPQQASSMYSFDSTRFGSSISASLVALHHP